MNNRFSLLTISHTDADGVDREYTLIVDENTRKTLNTPFGRVEEARAFLRCRGQQYVATYGKETPIMRGHDDEIYYQPWHCFDGTWSRSGKDSHEIHHYVTAKSGKGILFAVLEKFSAQSALEAVA